MYRGDDGTLILSPSDLVAHLECSHLTALERLVAEHRLRRPQQDDPEGDVLRRRGEEHEAAELARFVADGLQIAEITASSPRADDLVLAEEETVAAMQAGVDVVFQATFFDGRWRGQADFLRRIDTPSALGPWSYEVLDTKLARRAKPAALLQMCSYSEHVERIQGLAPREMVVVTGEGSHRRFAVSDVASYYRAAKRRFEAFVAEPLDGPGSIETYPHKVPHCRLCPWSEACDARRRADDHLSLVAGMRRDMIPKLAAAGVATAAELAGSPVGEPVARIGQATVDRLRHQARLQVAQRADGVVRYEVIEPAAPDVGETAGTTGGEADGEAVDDVVALGLGSLPAPSWGDLFFDIEGDPWVGDHGLEYLFGIVDPAAAPAGGEPAFHAFWAHSPSEEKRAFEQVVDLIIGRLDADPAMHVYHYAPYELTVLRDLMGRYATREAEVDRLLRADVFVDLYRVVRHGIRVSQEGYGLKKLEPLYLDARDGAITDGGSSIVVYEEWLATGNQSLLDDIGAYNEIDCRSTLELRDWLEARRAELEAAMGVPLPRPEVSDGAPKADQVASEAASTALAEALRPEVGAGAGHLDPVEAGRALLAGLVEYHRREAKPAYWWWFDRLEKGERELFDDHESIAGLTYEGEVGAVARSIVHRYRFDPSQEHKVGVGDKPRDPRTEGGVGEVVDLDAVAGTIDLKRSPKNPAPHPRALIPGPPILDTVLRQAVATVGAWVVEHGLDSDRPEHRAVRRLLCGKPPALRHRPDGALLVEPGEAPAEAARRLVPLLDGAVLAVQGPPGAGKTYTGAALVVDAVARGQRVAITANSHKAITNLVTAVCRRATSEGQAVEIVQKAQDGDGCTSPLVTCVARNQDVVAALDEGVQVAAGTAWLLSSADLADRFDLVVVDEASQLSLANAVAVAGCATNVVLLGDPQQLPQVSQGSHPDGVAVSALGHVMGTHAVVPADRGVFLDTSWRMHPDVCRLVSEIAYEGALSSHPSCAAQAVHPGPLLEGSGVRFCPVDHEGNRTRSAEEVAVVQVMVDALVGRDWTDAAGDVRPLRLEDVLVIAPFNAHVACLAAALPEGARVGTVDRFQGQEAPVVIYAMAASSSDDVPRGIDFLLSLNRLNVAISRARALSVVVASPRLLEARCRTPEQLRLANALCRLTERAHRLEVAVPA